MAYRVNLDVLESTIREVSRHLASLEAVEGDVKRAARLVGEHWQGRVRKGGPSRHSSPPACRASQRLLGPSERLLHGLTARSAPTPGWIEDEDGLPVGRCDHRPATGVA
ncbi:hypothetical protein KEM60_00068 [Austwickia sp. TVS 96-490-7B]|nr:hypothetical protein [Austwickia sp. TVS 96-490-7B]